MRRAPRFVAVVVMTALALLVAGPVVRAAPITYTPQITNGHDATPGQWPFMVGLLLSNVEDRFNAQFCGGALIEEDWVLTAAHCVVGDPNDMTPNQIDVLVGSTDLSAFDGARIRADSIVIHPDYNRSTQENDITLIHLSVAETAATINVATTADAGLEGAGNVVTLLGWGGTTTDQQDQTFATQLQEANMPVIADSQCSGDGFESFNATVMLCAGAPEQDADGGVDACQGDSGGPLFATNDQGQTTEIGIVSFGPTCGMTPTAYTRVSHFSGWISETTQDVAVEDDEVLPIDVFRIAGANRYATAAAFALDRWSSPIANLYIVTGESFADALAMSAVAAKGLGPVLLTTRDTLPEETRQALVNLQPSNIVIAGGPGAVSTAVEDQVRQLTGAKVVRRAGNDRYETAAALSSSAFRGLPGDRTIVFVGSGESFADALGGAAAAANRNKSAVPLLLTQQATLPTSTAEELRRLGPTEAFVLGGTAAISGEVVLAIDALGISVIRLAGGNRFDTAVQIATRVFGEASEAVVATGNGFPDGLVSGALGIPLLLVPAPDDVPGAVTGAIDSMGVDVITILGGRGAVSTAQAQLMANAR